MKYTVISADSYSPAEILIDTTSLNKAISTVMTTVECRLWRYAKKGYKVSVTAHGAKGPHYLGDVFIPYKFRKGKRCKESFEFQYASIRLELYTRLSTEKSTAVCLGGNMGVTDVAFTIVKTGKR